MADSIVVVISSASPQALGTALDLSAAAVALEMELHVYFTGDAVVWVGRPDGEASDHSATDALRNDVAERLRALKEDGTVNVYACSGAMKAHGIAPERLASEVDMPAGFVYILDLASRASITLNF
ncbi:MAG: DsrE family protein [Egibacteraceae bacterium]